MNINLDSHTLNSLSWVREKISSLTFRQKSMLTIATMALVCIATLHLLSRYCFFHGRKVSNLKLRLTGNGQGKITNLDGTIYEGQFKAGLLSGQGKITESEGSVWKEGEFYNGTLHGLGRMTFEAGQIKEGNFINGTLFGRHKVTLPNGKILHYNGF